MTMVYLIVVALPAIIFASWLFSLLFERPFVKSRLPMGVAAKAAVESIPLPLWVPAEVCMVNDVNGDIYAESEKKREPLKKSKDSRKKRARLY